MARALPLALDEHVPLNYYIVVAEAEASVTEHLQMRACLLLVLVAVFTGCSTTSSRKFEACQEETVVKGRGGTEKTIDGVEFWESGDPERKYEVIGFLYEDGGALWTSTESLRRKEAIIVKQNGGNAAIIETERELAGRCRNGTPRYRWVSRLGVVKYIG